MSGWLLAAGAAASGVALVVHGTAARNRWGMNLDPVRCPKCGDEAATPSRPGSVSQALWGGRNCRRCGCEYDKWGRSTG